MRALGLLPCRFWGGPEKQTLRLASWLRDNAAVETVFAVMPTDAAAVEQNPLLVRARAAGFEAAAFVQSRRYDLVEGVRLLRGLVSRFRPDVVCAMGYKADVLAAWAGGAPSVVTLRGWTAQDAKVRFFEWLDRRTLRRHESVIVVSNALRDAALGAGVAPERVFWVPNAIDPAQLPEPRRREDLCREIGADPARPLVGAVGRLSPEKGHRVLVEAHRVRIADPARDHECVVLLRADIGDLAVDVEGVGLVVVVEALDLALLERDELRLATGLFDRLPRLGELDLLDHVRREKGDLLTVQVSHR